MQCTRSIQCGPTSPPCAAVLDVERDVAARTDGEVEAGVEAQPLGEHVSEADASRCLSARVRDLAPARRRAPCAAEADERPARREPVPCLDLLQLRDAV